MLTSLHISGFRCFSQLNVENLRRINLIVGRNNSGKTCLLDALELLATGSATSLDAAAIRRDEIVFTEDKPDSFHRHADIRHMFQGHDAALGSQFRLEANGGGDAIQVHAGILLTTTAVDSIVLRLHVTDNGATNQYDSALGPEWSLQLAAVPSRVSSRPVRFVSTAALLGSQVAQIWGEVAARPAEDQVVQAVRIVERDVERVAAVGSGLFVRLKGSNDRVPIGSLGDGARHLLVLACQLVSAEKGLLLVDEIDTGLHVSTMVKMWQLVIGAAKDLDVQVFATTHSDDCLRALASVLQASPELMNEVALHRMERGADRAVWYSADEIIRSAAANIQVR